MKKRTTVLRLIAMLAVVALIATACSSDSEDTTTTTAATTTQATTTTSGGTGTTAATTTTQPPAAGFSYKVGIVSDITTDNYWAYLGPEADVYNGYVLGNSHPALWTLAYPNITHTPSIATAAPEEPFEEGGTWYTEATIRDNWMWSDGEPITIDDLIVTYEVVRDFDLGGNWPSSIPVFQEAVEDDATTEDVDESSPQVEGITGVEKVDDYSIKIAWSSKPGIAQWQNGIGFAAFMPEHHWAPHIAAAAGTESPSATLYAVSGEGEPSGSSGIYAGREPGAFARVTMNMDEYYAGTTYTFYADGSVRQENAAQGFDEVYGGSGSGDINAVYTEGPYADEVIYSVYSDQNSQVLALKDGEIDYILSSLGLQSGLREQITTAPNLSLIANASNGFRYLSYNMRKSPMSYKGFRKAVSCMIDKEFMATSVLGGAAIATYSLVPSGNVAWANPDVEELCKGLTQEERVLEAIRLLEADGFTWTTKPEWNADNLDVIPQGEGLKDPAGVTVPDMELLAPGPGYDPLRSTYSIWIAQWANDLGIPLTANPTGFSVIVDEVFAEGDLALDWDMYILGWGLGDPAFPDFHEAFFASYNDSADGGFNTPGFANDELDSLAADLLASTDVEAAKLIVKRMDQIVVEEAPYVVLFQTPILEAYRNEVQFPFVDTLDGLQNLGGVPASVVVSD